MFGFIFSAVVYTRITCDCLWAFHKRLCSVDLVIKVQVQLKYSLL